jgi:uncharacterized Zn finger protein (UPF0148 family)
MPLMQAPNCEDKECVVCPKLEKALAKYTTEDGLPKFTLESNPTEDSLFEIDEDDPVSLIIAEARRAIKSNAAPPNSPGGPANTKTRIEEAKLYLASKRKTEECDGSKCSNAKSKDTQPLTPDPSQMEASASGAAAPVDWDQLLVSGRALLSERLQQGWNLSTDNCAGEHCKSTPLLSKEGEEHVCTVCGGSGSGLDGAYAGEGLVVVQWDDLVTNGRAILTDRLKHGWVMSSENCNGVNCRGTPLTQFEDGPLSCVVCGGCGSGFDGAYAFMKSEEVLEAERALVSQEIGYLMSVGWVLRDSLCDKCQMPLVAEQINSEDMCILCGKNPLNDMLNGPNMMENAYFDDNANEAGQRLALGWRLGDASPLCMTCGGIQMIPPNSKECGCINRACPKALPAALAWNPNINLHVPMIASCFENQAIQSIHQTNAEVLKTVGNKISDKLSISSLLKDGLVPLMVCGAPDYADDHSALSDDNSMVRSTTANALGAILTRLDQAKYQLELLRENGQYGTDEAAMKQAEVAMLIEKLANAAVAMKTMEDIEAREPPLSM